MRPSERYSLEAILEGRSLWAPQSRPQWLALLSQADELFYGGQAGGGKSDLILGLGCTAHKKSIIYRREFSQLTGAAGLIERSREILGSVASYNGQEHVWRGIPGGRMVEFGGVQHEQDKTRYQGRAHDLKAFDEVSEFTETQYLFLTGWARSTDEGQRVRIVATGNPPTHADGLWVIQRWAPWLDDKHPNPARSGELRWFARLDGEDREVEGPDAFEHNGETIYPKSRTFIPAALADNVYLAGTDYEAQLQALPEPLRSQMLYGDFSIGIKDDPYQVIPTLWVLEAFRRYREREQPETPLTALGVDVARGGQDRATIYRRFDNYWPPALKYPGIDVDDGPAMATLVIEALGEEMGAQVNLDVIGVGSSPYDSLAHQGGLNVNGINFAEASDKRDRSGRLKMRNKRAEAYWMTREALEPGLGDDLAIAPDNELLADLTAPRYKVTPQGITIEDKDAIKKRLGRSPDSGDAFVLSLMEGGWLIYLGDD